MTTEWKINQSLLATRNGKGLNHFTNSIGERIHCRHWEPEGRVRGMILLLHGYGEHCGRYVEFAKQLTTIGLLVFAHDHTRHGRNAGPFDIIDYKQFIADALQHVKIMNKMHPGMPLYLFGHSMGGCVAVFTASEKPALFKGVILTGPMLTIDPKFTRSKVRVGSVFNNLLPTFAVERELHPEKLSRDEAQVQKHRNDPLVYHGTLRLRTAYQLYLMMVDVQECLALITQPLLVMHGGNDEICSLRGSENLIAEAKSKDKTLKIFDGAKHELVFESENVPNEVYSTVLGWITQRLGSTSD